MIRNKLSQTISVTVFLIAGCLSLITTPALAHILLTDQSIGAVVHITPDDDPIAGQNADFFFEFKDKANKFDPAQCICTYEISEDSKPIAHGDLFSGSTDPSLENASFNFTFPSIGLYTLTIKGQPKTPGAFNEFTLSDTVRVERASEQQTNDPTVSSNFFTSHWIHFTVFGVGLGIFLILLFFKVKKES